MTSENIFKAMRGIDMQFILDAAPDIPQKKSIIRPWMKWTALAACLAFIIYLLPTLRIAFTGANAPGPVSVNYSSCAEMNTALGKDTLYTDSKISAEADEFYIRVSYPEDESGNPMLSDPYQVNITHVSGSIRVNYYILFGRDDVDDSRIGGYEEQKLRYEINGVTVHYSKIFDGSVHSQAKFVYGDDLYVIDIASQEDNYDINTYIDTILG